MPELLPKFVALLSEAERASDFSLVRPRPPACLVHGLSMQAAAAAAQQQQQPGGWRGTLQGEARSKAGA